MKLVHLTNNVIGAEPQEILVSNEQFKKIEQLQYCGGFLRFGIDVYGERKRGKSEREKLVEFMCTVFRNRAIIEALF